MVFSSRSFLFIFFFNDTATTEIYTLSLHDALPISHQFTTLSMTCPVGGSATAPASEVCLTRSEEHTSELQSRFDLVCRLLLEKKKIIPKSPNHKKQQSNYFNTACTLSSASTCVTDY